MNFKLIVLILIMLVTGCAGIAFNGAYNPEETASSLLAKVSNAKRGWLDSTFYKIVAANDNQIPPMGVTYNKFAAGVYILDWRLTNMEEGAFGSSERELDRGRVIADLVSGGRYIIGANPETVGGAAIYLKSESITKQIVSIACEIESCSKMRDDILSGAETLESLQEKLNYQSELDFIKSIKAPTFDQFKK